VTGHFSASITIGGEVSAVHVQAVTQAAAGAIVPA